MFSNLTYQIRTQVQRFHTVANWPKFVVVLRKIQTPKTHIIFIKMKIQNKIPGKKIIQDEWREEQEGEWRTFEGPLGLGSPDDETFLSLPFLSMLLGIPFLFRQVMLCTRLEMFNLNPSKMSSSFTIWSSSHNLPRKSVKILRKPFNNNC